MTDTPSVPTVDVQLEADQLNALIMAMHESLLEDQRYISGYHGVGPKPEPHQQCCPHHRLRYERDLEQKQALEARHASKWALLVRLEKALTSLSQEDDNR